MLLRTLSSTVLALALLSSPAYAAKAELTPDGRFLDVTETTPGEANSMVASLMDDPGGQYVKLYDDQNMTPGRGCRAHPDFGTIRCDDPIEQVRVWLGGGNDRFLVSESGTVLTFGAGSLLVDLGDGNDEYNAESTNATAVVHGGNGNDTFVGGLNVDRFFGGEGDDTLKGNQGADELHGEGGNDTLVGDLHSEHGIFGDVLDGGAGIDTVDDWGYSGDPMLAPPVSVTLDGIANDGRAGEGDNVVAVERILSRSAGTLVGDDGPNELIAPETGRAGVLRGLGGNDVIVAGDSHGDVIDGGAGDDDIQGGFGDDTIVGGPGRDTIHGDRKSRCNELHCDLAGFGNDTIDVRDGEIDSVTCGPGADRVIADANDVIAADCEIVERAAAPSTGPEGKTGEPRAKADAKVKGAKLAKALKSGLTVTVSGVTGTVKLTAKQGKKTVASGSAKAKSGKATIKLTFTKAAKKALKGKKSVVLSISGGGAAVKYTLKR